jgi:adenylosuccinate lyase
MQLLAMIAATFDKIGHEIYNLQRPELGEVREGFVGGVVGSITIPHKRNPEIAEHLGSLARLIRHNAACLAENLVHDHERDGRSWKAEWGLIGPTCVMLGSVLRLGKLMCANLQFDYRRQIGLCPQFVDRVSALTRADWASDDVGFNNMPGDLR